MSFGAPATTHQRQAVERAKRLAVDLDKLQTTAKERIAELESDVSFLLALFGKIGLPEQSASVQLRFDAIASLDARRRLDAMCPDHRAATDTANDDAGTV